MVLTNKKGEIMPVLSLFYGIIIRMYSEPNIKHNIPHIHAEYQGKEAVFDLEGNLLEGEIPNKQKKYVVAWIDIHEEDLKANWKLLQEGQGYFKIQPLQ
jgi:hypothetical protein